ncbi:cytoskeleton-associated protein 2-like [Mustelus asterias]
MAAAGARCGRARLQQSEFRRQQLEAYLSQKGKLKVAGPDARYYLGDKTNRKIQPPTASFKVGLGGGGGPTKPAKPRGTDNLASTNRTKAVAANSKTRGNTKPSETLSKAAPALLQTRIGAHRKAPTFFPVASKRVENETPAAQTAQSGQYGGSLNPAAGLCQSDNQEKSRQTVDAAPNTGHSVSTASIKPFTNPANKTQAGKSKNAVSENRLRAVGIGRTTKAAPGAAKWAAMAKTAPGAAKTVGTARAAPGADKPVGTARVAHGAAKPVGTARAAPGVDKPVGTARVAHGAAKPVGTARAAPGVDKPVGTARVAHGAAKPVGTARAAHGATRPVGTARVAHGADKAVGIAKVAPRADKPVGIAKVAPGVDKPVGIAKVAPGADKPVGIAGAAHGVDKPVGIAGADAKPVGMVPVSPQFTDTDRDQSDGYQRLRNSTQQLTGHKTKPTAGLPPPIAIDSTANKPVTIWQPFTRSARRLHPAWWSAPRSTKGSNGVVHNASKSTTSALDTGKDGSTVRKTVKGQAERRKRLEEWLLSKGKTYKRPPMPTPFKRSVQSVKKNLELSFQEAIEEEEEEQRSLTSRVNHMLDDCMRLLEKGSPPEQVSATLQNVPEGEKFAKYWICRARLLELTGPMEAVVALFEQAVHSGAEPVEELRSALVKTIMRNANSQTALPETGDDRTEDDETEDCVELATVTPHATAMRILCEETESHGSSVVKYRVTATPQVLRGKETVDRMRSVGKREVKFLTPVRRSVRIEHASTSHPAMLKEHDYCVTSLDELLAVEEAETFVYRENRALLGE